MASLLAAAAAVPAAAGPTGWAHQAAGFQSNGTVTVKSLAGGAYAGTQNPTGAVAKANQSAATQAPTVIIQATGAVMTEALPIMKTGTTTTPVCPPGYISKWTTNSSSWNASYILYNIAGTIYSFGIYGNSNAYFAGFMRDGVLSPGYGAQNAQGAGYGLSLQGDATSAPAFGGTLWSANLCTK